MTRQAFLNKLEGLMELDPNTLRGDEQLAALSAWDSLVLMSFIALVHKQMGVRLVGKQIAECKTVDDLTQLVGDKIQG